MTNKELITNLCGQCKASNLPKSMKQSQRKYCFDVAKQAQGWLKSSFFSEVSTENQHYIDALNAALK